VLAWFLDRVLPGMATGLILGTIGYIKLHFEKKWPYWGKTKEGTGEN
jgi:hypothetical protein